jgi:hypothetical protein
MPMTAYTITFGINHETDPFLTEVRDRTMHHYSEFDCPNADCGLTPPARSSRGFLTRITNVARTFGFLTA